MEGEEEFEVLGDPMDIDEESEDSDDDSTVDTEIGCYQAPEGLALEVVDDSSDEDLEWPLLEPNDLRYDSSATDTATSDESESCESEEEEEEQDDYLTTVRHHIHRQSDMCAVLRKTQRENETLRWRIRILNAICGFRFCPIAHGSALIIQAHARGFLTRVQRRRAEQILATMLEELKVLFRRLNAYRELVAAIRIQARIRGTSARRTMAGRSVCRVLEMRRRAVELEALMRVFSLDFGAAPARVLRSPRSIMHG